MQKNYLIPGSILIAGLLIAGAVVYSTGLKAQNQPQSKNNPAEEKVSLALGADDVILGNPNAPITIVEYADFQCPFCAHYFSDAEKSIKDNFVKAGKVKIVYRHFAFLGPESTGAAQAAECAKDQGKFWEYHDELYKEEIKDGSERNGNLNEALFKKIAARLGMNGSDFAACVSSKKYAGKVDKDYELAQTYGVGATPSIILGNGNPIEIDVAAVRQGMQARQNVIPLASGAFISGALPYAQFETILNSLLK